MNKRTLAAVLVLTLCLLSACGRRKTPEPAVSSSQEETILKLDTLAVELPRDLDTAAARKAMAALPELLAPEGVEVEELSVTFGTSHAATIQALEEIRNLSAEIFVIMFFEKLSYLYSLLINFIPKS